MNRSPYVFDEFFASGLEESISPFLTKSSRHWGKNLEIKVAVTAAIVLLLSFSLSFFYLSLSYILLTFVFFLVGTPALMQSIEDCKNLEINIDVLMTLAAFLSVAVGGGFEGALLLVLFNVSGAMEQMVTHKTKGALHSLHRLSPKQAYILDINHRILPISIHDVKTGMHIYVQAGEIVPLDAKVIKGTSSVNLVHLTGESMPVSKKAGMEIPAGAVNIDAALTLEVLRTSSDSTLCKIIDLITKAQKAKPKIQKILDVVGQKYAISIIFLTVLIATILPWLFSMPYLGVEGSIYRSLAFLIAASPCALIIATPTAYLSAISACAKKGILLKGGITLDAIASCHVISFDKTGTLTTGKLTVESFDTLEGSFSKQQALRIAYGLEKHVTHPIAQAIMSYAEKNISLLVTLKSFLWCPAMD
jgi:Cd2+/Zn2+-exporting ATPase